MDEPDILEEKSQENDQMETEATIKLSEEELKTKLLNEIDEEDKKKFENLKARDILELTEKQWKEIFETIKGIAYFNRISKIKEKIGKKRKLSFSIENLPAWKKRKHHIDRNEWEYSEKIDYVNELLKSESEVLDSNVNRFKMKNYLQLNEKKSTDIFLRQSQRELWQQVFDYLENTSDSHAIITGNPGIGKSRSMMYFLKLLLEKKKTIIFEARKDGNVFAFIPSSEDDYKYQLWECSLNKFDPPGCQALYDPENYYLLDLMKDGEKVIQVEAHTVVCASPRIFHNLKDFKVRDLTKKFIMPIWKKEEIKPLCNYISVNNCLLSDLEFQNRYTVFGGRIRFIFSSNAGEFSNQIRSSIALLKIEELKKIVTFSDIPPDINIEIGPSMIFVYDEKETNLKSKYKYEMIEENYFVKLGSEVIVQYVAWNYWNVLKNFLDPTGLYYKQNPFFCGHIFEIISKIIIQFGGEFNVYNFRNKKVDELKLKKGKFISKGNSWEEYYTECINLPSINDSENSITERIIYVPYTSNQPVIDVMDSCDRAYQFTTSSSHSINIKHLQKLMFKITKINEQNPLKLYFVIPKQKLTEFKYTYENEDKILSPFELSDIRNLEIFLFKSLKVKGKNDQEIQNILDKLKKSNYFDNLLEYIHKNLIGITSKEKMKQYLKNQSENLKKKIQCFIVCINEKFETEDQLNIVDFIKNLCENSFSQIKK